MLVDVYTRNGDKAGQIELRDDVFAAEPNENAMHQTVVGYLARQRKGTHKTKTRSEVSGGGKKPWRQKGRGTARAGSIRSPLWVGGGTIFGPQPHKYNFKVNRKVKKIAKRSAISLRLKEENLIVLEDFNLDGYKTREMAQTLTNLNIDYETTLILLPQADSEELKDANRKLYFSTRNIAGAKTCEADKVSAYDILKSKKIVIFKSAVATIHKTFSN